MRVKAHKRYKLKDGTYVPGVTTVTSLLAKPFLRTWANRLGLEGIDINKYVDAMADIGTLTHYLIECHLKQVPPKIDEWSKEEIDTAKRSFQKFLDWLEESKFKVEASELSLVSETHRFGGTCDMVGWLGEKRVLIDIKTSKAIYPEMATQVSAYKALLEEKSYKIDEVRILRIGRTEREGEEFKRVGGINLHWKRFLRLLDIYNINKELGL